MKGEDFTDAELDDCPKRFNMSNPKCIGRRCAWWWPKDACCSIWHRTACLDQLSKCVDHNNVDLHFIKIKEGR